MCAFVCVVREQVTSLKLVTLSLPHTFTPPFFSFFLSHIHRHDECAAGSVCERMGRVVKYPHRSHRNTADGTASPKTEV